MVCSRLTVLLVFVGTAISSEIDSHLFSEIAKAALQTQPYIKKQNCTGHSFGNRFKPCANMFLWAVNGRIDSNYYMNLDRIVSNLAQLMIDLPNKASLMQLTRNTCKLYSKWSLCIKYGREICAENQLVVNDIDYDQRMNQFGMYDNHMCASSGELRMQFFVRVDQSDVGKCVSNQSVHGSQISREITRGQDVLYDSITKLRYVMISGLLYPKMIERAKQCVCGTLQQSMNSAALAFRKFRNNTCTVETQLLLANLPIIQVPGDVLETSGCKITQINDKNRLQIDSNGVHYFVRRTSSIVGGFKLTSGFLNHMMAYCTNLPTEQELIIYEYDLIKVTGEAGKWANSPMYYLKKITIEFRDRNFQQVAKIELTEYTKKMTNKFTEPYNKYYYPISQSYCIIEIVNEDTILIKDGNSGAVILINRFRPHGILNIYSILIRVSSDVEKISSGMLIGGCVNQVVIKSSDTTDYFATHSKDKEAEIVSKSVPKWEKLVKNVDRAIVQHTLKVVRRPDDPIITTTVISSSVITSLHNSTSLESKSTLVTGTTESPIDSTLKMEASFDSSTISRTTIPELKTTEFDTTQMFPDSTADIVTTPKTSETTTMQTTQAEHLSTQQKDEVTSPEMQISTKNVMMQASSKYPLKKTTTKATEERIIYITKYALNSSKSNGELASIIFIAITILIIQLTR